MIPIDDSAPPPADGQDRVGRAVAAFNAVGRRPEEFEAGGQAINVSKPIPIYGLRSPRGDSDPQTILSRVRRIGWRYLVFQGDTSGVADIKHAMQAPELIRSSSLVNRIVNTGAFAETAVQHDPSYHTRLLDLSMFGHAVLWLVSDNNKPDRFFTLADRPQELDRQTFLGRISTAERQKAAAFAAEGSSESGG